MEKEKETPQDSEGTPKNSEEETPKKVKINFGGIEVEVTIDKDGHIIIPAERLELKGGADNFKGLPMSELIANSLLAAAEAQEKPASITLDYFKRIACEDDGKTTRIQSFDLNKPVGQDGVVGQEIKQTVQAPFIRLVPIPSLLVERTDVDFQMEIGTL
jgi:hypothetical protein